MLVLESYIEICRKFRTTKKTREFVNFISFSKQGIRSHLYILSIQNQKELLAILHKNHPRTSSFYQVSNKLLLPLKSLSHSNLTPSPCLPPTTFPTRPTCLLQPARPASHDQPSLRRASSGPPPLCA